MSDREKRRFLRLRDYFRVTFRPAVVAVAADTLTAEDGGVGFSKNLSVGGICLAVDEPLEPRSAVDATIHIPEIEAPLRIRAEVVRCDPSGGRYEVALRFLPVGMDEADRERLERFIYARLIDGERVES